MKRLWLAVAISLILTGTTKILLRRWHEERADRRVTLLADWSEVRDWSSRSAIPDPVLLELLKRSGINAVMIGAATVQDYLSQDFTFERRPSAEFIQRQLLSRGVTGVAIRLVSGNYRLFPGGKSWDRLKDLEVGFNPDLLERAKAAGLRVVLRVNQDPWQSDDDLFLDLQKIRSAQSPLGYVLNTDEIPGGPDALPRWQSLLHGEEDAHLLFEFHPTKAAMKLAFLAPAHTYRAHTIAPNELKDMTEAQQRARWRRAAEERSCRFLLLHVSPNDSFSSYLSHIVSLKQEFLGQNWEISWPKPRKTWSFPSFEQRHVAPFLALLAAILFPVLVLRTSLDRPPWPAFIQIVFLTVISGCVVAALAESPHTRVEIVAFRGIKMAFAFAWFGCFISLYSWDELRGILSENVRRVDLLFGLLAAGLIGYVLVRMGNASTGWKLGWEQGFRDYLETLLIARPRFKEFAVGYPLLLLGLHLGRTNAFGRLLIGVGMIGPISMINTFCHLHSPLYLTFWRSANGVLIGAMLGYVLIAVTKRGLRSL